MRWQVMVLIGHWMPLYLSLCCALLYVSVYNSMSHVCTPLYILGQHFITWCITCCSAPISWIPTIPCATENVARWWQNEGSWNKKWVQLLHVIDSLMWTSQSTMSFIKPHPPMIPSILHCMHCKVVFKVKNHQMNHISNKGNKSNKSNPYYDHCPWWKKKNDSVKMTGNGVAASYTWAQRAAASTYLPVLLLHT